MSESIAAAPAAVSAPVTESTTPETAAIETSVETTEGEAPAIETAAEVKKEEAKKAANIRKLKLKVNGKEEDYDLDLDNNEELIKHLQMSKASQAKMQESAQLRKEVEQFFDLLKKNPRKVLSDPSLSIDVKKFAEDIINEEIENMQKSPEQKEKEKLQAELEEIKAKLKSEEEAKTSAERARMEQEMVAELDRDIEQALTSNELPKSPVYIKRMAEYMMLALNNGINLKPKDVIQLVKKDVQSELKQYFEVSPDEVLENLLGKDRLSKMRKKQITQTKQAIATANSVKATGNDEKPRTPVKVEKIPMNDFFKKLGK